MADKQWLTIRQASDLIGYSEEYIRRKAHEGAINSKKFGIQYMIDVDDLKAYAERMGYKGKHD